MRCPTLLFEMIPWILVGFYINSIIIYKYYFSFWGLGFRPKTSINRVV